MIVGTIVCLVGLAWLLVAEVTHTSRTIAKTVASTGFVLVGFFAAGTHPFDVLIVVGLAFGMLGDLFLLSEDLFVSGLAVFLTGHLCYAVAFVIRADHLVTAWALLPLATSAIAVRWLAPKLGSMRIPVFAYVATITVMVIAAQAVYVDDGIRHGTRLVIGAWLFYASDLCVAREKFVARGLENKLIGLPLYYGGQLLIAWSL